MKRKNKKRIDPRYFLEETTNRDQFVEQKAKPETGPVPKRLKDKPIGYEEKVGSKSVEYDDEGNVIKCKATGQMKCPQKENKAPIKETRYPVKVPPYQPQQRALQPQVVLERPPLAGDFTAYGDTGFSEADFHLIDAGLEASMFGPQTGMPYPEEGVWEPNPEGWGPAWPQTITGTPHADPRAPVEGPWDSNWQSPYPPGDDRRDRARGFHGVVHPFGPPGKRDESTAAESALFAAEDDAADEDEAYEIQDAVAAILPGEVLQEQVGLEVGAVDDAEMASMLMRGVSSGNQKVARAAYDILTQFAIYSSGFNHSLLASKIGRILKAYYLREKYGVEGAFLRDWVTGDKPLSAGMSVRVSPWEETKISASEMQTILAQAIRMTGDRKEHPEVLSRLAVIEDQGTRSEPRLSEAKLNQVIQEELQKLLQELDFGDRRRIRDVPNVNLPAAALEPLPADEMDELMGIVHGPRGSGTIYDAERAVGTPKRAVGTSGRGLQSTSFPSNMLPNLPGMEDDPDYVPWAQSSPSNMLPKAKEWQQLISEGPDPMWNRDDDEDALFAAEDTEDQPGSGNRLIYGEYGDEA